MIDGEEFNRRASFLHDLRTPLNGITGMLELIQMRSKDESTAEFATVALSSAEDLIRLMDAEVERLADQRP